MSYQAVNVGGAPNDNTGDLLRNAFIKLNANDAELYSLVGGDARQFPKNTHGFVVGNLIYIDGSGVPQLLTNPNTQQVVGMVSQVVDANNFMLTMNGAVSGLSGLTSGSTYYIQADGSLSTTVSSHKFMSAFSATGAVILSGGGAGLVVKNYGTPLTVRSFLNFKNGLTAVDNNPDVDVKWGGTLSEDVNIDGPHAIYIGDDVGQITAFSARAKSGANESTIYTLPTSAAVFSQDAAGGTRLLSTPSSIRIEKIDLSAFVDVYQDVASIYGATAVDIDGSATTITASTLDIIGNGAGFAGAKYSLDYSANFTARSLIDKGYADATYAPISGGPYWNLASGGTLTGGNTITMGSNAITFSGNRVTFGPTATNSGLNVGSYAGSPSSLSNGDVWYNSSFAHFAGRHNGSTVGFVVVGNVGSYNGNGVPYFTNASNPSVATSNSFSFNTTAGLTVLRATISQLALSSSWVTALTVTPGAHTSITNTLENTDFDFGGSSSITQTWAGGGTVALQRQMYVRGRTLAGSSSQTFTVAASVYIDGHVVGTNATVQTGYGLYVNQPTASGGTLNSTRAAGFNGYVSILDGTGANAFLMNRDAGTNGAMNFIQSGTGNMIFTHGSNTGRFSSNGRFSARNGSTGGFAIWNGSADLVSITSNGGNLSPGIGMDFAVSASYSYYFSGHGKFRVVQSAVTSTSQPGIEFTPGAHTALAANTEVLYADFQGAPWTWADGTIPTQRFYHFKSFTVQKTTTSLTATNIYTVYVEPSTPGSGVTLTNNYAIGSNGNIRVFNLADLIINVGTTNYAILRGNLSNDVELAAGAGNGANPGRHLYLTSGAGGLSGNQDAGNINIATGVPNASGAEGSVNIQTRPGAKIGFFGATAVVKQAGLTAITHTAPGTPDYAIQDLTNSGGFGFATKDEGNTVLSVIKAMHDAMKLYGLLT